MDDLANEWQFGLLQCVLWMARSGDRPPPRTVLRWLIARVSVWFREAVSVARHAAPAIERRSWPGRRLSVAPSGALRAARICRAGALFQLVGIMIAGAFADGIAVT